MSGVHRFLSRRDKKHHHPAKDPQQPQKVAKTPEHFGGLFTLDEAHRKKPDKEEEKKIKAILARLHSYGIEHFSEANVEYALRSDSSNGDPEAAMRLLMLIEDTYEGILRPFDADARLLGAVNRENVTCFLDALLFAMFARLDSFEAMLYENFEDLPRRKLAGMLRLWVNMLRSGKLIPTDITRRLQESLAECGWEDGARLKQQDPSEAFGFITGKLELPLLTLKMDLYHTGKDDTDDHKFINERLLEVAIVDQPSEGNSVVTLEDCLEHYFNNRIEVKRHMEAQRRNTLQSARVGELNGQGFDFDEKKESGMHIEVAEIPGTPAASTPVADSPNPFKAQANMLRPGTGRKRADSIFSQRKVSVPGTDLEKTKTNESEVIEDAKGTKMSTKTEVLMPAWQFFKLLPWYTDHMPTSDAQVAAHFSRKRPVLGICLKRYAYTNQGEPTRLGKYIDIPLEIAVPNFVSDDNMQDEGPLVGNFRLLLQSVVCHRGMSVNSGHYICLARGQTTNAERTASANSRSGSESDIDEQQDPWLRFDDMAKERISYVDIHKALREETPYLLFYQVQPIGDDGHSIHDLPSYAEATSRSESDAMPLEKPGEVSDSEMALTETISESARHVPESTTETTDFSMPPSTRPSMDIPGARHLRGRSADRNQSIAFDEGSFAGSTSAGSVRTDAASNSVPVTPIEEKGNAFLSVAKSLGSRRASRVSNKASPVARSRPPSAGPPAEKEASRFSLNMAKLTSRMSRADMRDSSNSNSVLSVNTEVPIIKPSDAVAAELAGERDVATVSTPTSAVDKHDPSPDYVAAPPLQATAGAEQAGAPKSRPQSSATAVPAPAHDSTTAATPAPDTSRKRKDKDKAGKDLKKRLSMHHRGDGQEDRECVVM